MSQFPRSTRAGIIPVLAGVVFALAGCRDSTGVTLRRPSAIWLRPRPAPMRP